MATNNRVFITGSSALTASGMTLDDTWAALLAGHSGLAPIQHWPLEGWSHVLGGELKTAPMLADRKLMKAIARQDVMGISAAMTAIEQSQLLTYRQTLTCEQTFNAETAVYVGSPGNKYFQQYDFLPLLAKAKGDMRHFAKELFNEVHPMWLLRILPNNVLAYTGILSGFKGQNHNITNHAVSGLQALLEAYHAIRNGLAQRAVVVAYDIGTEPQALFYYERLGVISRTALKPFDQAHDGTLLADGASALILESEASVQARGATCFAEMLGGVSRTEAAGLFSIDTSGEALAQCLRETLAQHALTSTDVNLVVAHGNGNPLSDISEACAITDVLGAVPVSAFKWSMGHTLCTSGILDVVLATRALADQVIPGVATLDHLAPTCQGLNIQRETRALQGHTAMVINRGFASMNACVVIRR